MPQYVATINVPGYSPMDDEPPVFDTPGEAWAWLAEERRHGEDHVGFVNGESPYSECVKDLESKASLNHGPDTIYSDTPGYDGEHDFGLAYTVSIAEQED
jgi:hypothetical protein